MKYRVLHQTMYTNTTPVSVGYNEVWLTPRGTDRQSVLTHRIDIEPEPSNRGEITDYFGNTVTQILFNQGYSTLSISSVNEIEVAPSTVSPAKTIPWEDVQRELQEHRTLKSLEAYEFAFESPRCRLSDEFADYGRDLLVPGCSLRDFLFKLMNRFHSEFQFDSTATNVSTPVEQVFRQRRGVCQDFSHLMISILRSLGFAARYVSGYLRTVPPPGKPRLVGADNSHAWVGIYAGDGDWIDIDPTNNQFPSTDHVTVAWGRDYSDVAPVKGVYIGGSSLRLTVSVDVSPMEDPPPLNPTRPPSKAI
ncbi:MAG: transglutaminase family protein [Planctomycetaceae bacterium]|nr:transglutaminase family protein [Planctomycetaceae bacterium]